MRSHQLLDYVNYKQFVEIGGVWSECKGIRTIQCVVYVTYGSAHTEKTIFRWQFVKSIKVEGTAGT